MRTSEGVTVGEHIGLMFYTIGQRKGIGLGGRRDADGSPWYVAHKDIERNELIVVQGHDHPLLWREQLVARDLAWVAGEAPCAHRDDAGKTRYRQVDAPCMMDFSAPDSIAARFMSPQWAVTPGQSFVLYRGEACLGGGVIQ